MPTMQLQSVGMVSADLFMEHEYCRIKSINSRMALQKTLSKYNLSFNTVVLEMFFYAETSSFKYYSIGDFEYLCIQCIDFSVLKSKVEFEIPELIWNED